MLRKIYNLDLYIHICIYNNKHYLKSLESRTPETEQKTIKTRNQKSNSTITTYCKVLFKKKKYIYAD